MMASKKQTKNRYLLIDGNALVHRAFYAVPLLSTKNGEPTNAVYGFATILLKAIKDLNPTHIACCFDLAGPTFRHELYQEYKATRVKAAPELYQQFPRIKELLTVLNVPIFEKEGFEADDLLGTLATKICKSENSNTEVMIASGDFDILQLVNSCVKVYTLRKGIADTVVYDEKAVRDRYHFAPAQIIDYKALRGDSSDNIKGIKGIGEKIATELIIEFGSLNNIYQAISLDKKIGTKIKPRILKLLQEGEADARLSFELASIINNVDIKFEIPVYQFGVHQINDTIKLLQELQFRTLLDKLPKNYAVFTSDEVKVGEINTQPEKNNNIGRQDYHLVDTLSKLTPVLEAFKNNTEVVVDTETDQLNPINATIIGLSLCFKDGEAYYVTAEVLRQSDPLKQFLEDEKINKIGQNIKYDLLILENAGINLKPVYFDTMIASYLLEAGTRQHSLDAIAFNLLGYQMQPITDLIGSGKSQISMKEVTTEKVSWYACEDADITWRIKSILEQAIKQESLEKTFYDIELPLVPVLASMERAGITADTVLLHKFSKEAEILLKDLIAEIYQQAGGEEFNIASPKQVQEVLFDRLGIDKTFSKKNKTGYSTSASELEKLRGQHSIIEKILQYRELAKLQSTYLLSLPKLVNQHTGRIHTSYNQTIAATGRLSSVDPNLQNIPVKGTGLGAKIRQAFIAKEGYSLVSLDYSQIELRIVAHLSQDKNMLKVFTNNEDIHTNTAVAVFGVTADRVTPDMRRDAKIINFGILYGLSSFGLSSRIGEVSNIEAKEFIDKYFGAYPDVQRYVESIKLQVREAGYIRNELGRLRKFPEIQSSQFFVRQAAERAAVNFPIQSLSADIIKIAMINIHKLIFGQSQDIQMLLQVHDELVFEIKNEQIKKYVAILKPLMEEAVILSVPIKVEAKAGANWAGMQAL